MQNTKPVHIRVDDHDDATKIAAVLEALGYAVVRELGDSDAQTRVRWAVDRMRRTHRLTSREAEVLEHVLAHGRTGQQIADEIGLTRATIKFHLHGVFTKTGAANREHLIRMALQLELPTDIEPTDDSDEEPTRESTHAVVASPTWR